MAALFEKMNVVWKCGFCGGEAEASYDSYKITTYNIWFWACLIPRGWKWVGGSPWCGMCDPRDSRSND